MCFSIRKIVSMKRISVIVVCISMFFLGMLIMNVLHRQNSYQKPVDRLVCLASGFLVSRALYVVAELQIADEMVDGPKTSQEIANRLNLNVDAVFRLLRMLVSHGVFICQDNKFALNELAELITMTHPQSMHGFLLHEDRDRWNAYGHMSYSIRTGKATFDHLYGLGYFDYIAQDTKKSEQFDRGMATLSETENRQVATHFDFGLYATIIDVGGGVGGLLAQIMHRHKNSSGILYELPHIENIAQKYLAMQYLDNRVKVVSGNFLNHIASHGDLYLLKRILHDWNDEISIQILKNCRIAMAQGAKIVVFDCVVPEGSEFNISKDIDIIMMTVFGGKERTSSDFEKLFAAAGLQIDKISPIAGTMLYAIEGSIS